MYKSLVALAFALTVTGCATTQARQATAEECTLVDQDMTGSHISKTQECTPAAGGEAAQAPK